MTKPRRRFLAVMVALAAAVAVFLLLRERREAEPLALTKEAPPLAPPRDDSGMRYLGQATIQRAEQREAANVSAARLREQYEAYKAGSVYPDWSYPLTADQAFLLKWNATVTNDLPFGESGKIFFRFDASAGRVFPGEAYTSWAEAWTMENGKKKRLPFDMEIAKVVLTGGPHHGPVFDLVYNDDGKNGDKVAGDLVYTNSFVPSERDELSRANSARIEAYVNVGGTKRRFLRDFVWAPRPVLDVVGITDSLEDGSLVATLDCEVYEAGLYTAYGNLFAADGVTPIATSKKSYALEAGRQKVKLVFFGKVLNDQQIDGPYVLKDVHGLKRMGEDEYQNLWWQHPAAYRTKTYVSTAFSGDEWNDPERQERLATFERVIAEAEGQR